MAKTNRQKYNFLAALMTQLEGAMSEGDVLYEQYVEFHRLLVKTKELEARYDALNQWVAQLELALEELDDDGSASASEEPESYDDGDDYDELDGVEPQMGGERAADGRLAANLGRAGTGRGPGRSELVERSSKARVSLGTKVERGTK